MEKDEELIGLEKVRDELVEKVLHLQQKLREKQQNPYAEKKIINMKKIDEILSQTSIKEDSIDEEKNVTKLLELTQNLNGIEYNNVQKKWLKDNTWLYSAQVIMKTLDFDLNLTVNEMKDSYEIEDIICHFIEVEASVMEEVTPWVLLLAKSKNFTFLMSAFSEYNDQYSIRKKILNKMQMEKCAIVDRNTEEGGVIVYIHSPKTAKLYYAEYLWKIRMNPITRSMEHYFVINGIDNEFIDANQSLIEEFGKSPLTGHDLKRLWGSLCIAIKEYK